MEKSFKTIVVIFVVESAEKAEDSHRGDCFSKGPVTFRVRRHILKSIPNTVPSSQTGPLCFVN